MAAEGGRFNRRALGDIGNLVAGRGVAEGKTLPHVSKPDARFMFLPLFAVLLNILVCNCTDFSISVSQSALLRVFVEVLIKVLPMYL